MTSDPGLQITRFRPLLFILTALLHVIIIVFVAINMETFVQEEEPAAGVMKLVDVEEDIPPPPVKLPDTPFTNTLDSVAEQMIEAEVITPPIIGYTAPPKVEENVYLQQHMISVLPKLPEDQIVRNTVYPPIAQRSNIEGMVYLELFIDRQGNVREVRILRENPPNRGFGEAAINAFKGIKGIPAEANGEAVGVRFRYNFTFKLN
jgi:protein TonB